jgi:AraC-like DNA-binding protein
MVAHMSIDVLSDVLETVRVRSACYGRFELGAPFGVAIPASEDAKFHVVLEGNCCLRVNDAELSLSSGDLVALPHGDAHAISDRADRPVEPFEALLKGRNLCQEGVLRVGDGVAAVLVSGCFRFESRRNNPLLAALPAVIALRGERSRAIPWLDTTLKFMGCEVASRRPGAQTVISRLADVLFIQIVRGCFDELSADAAGWLGALKEPQVGSALRLIHQNPEHAWTVASLAAKVGMSRSAFAERFTRLAGEPPLAYLTRWRMLKAAGLLREGQATLAEVAGRVGYESEAAFSKAFKRSLGSTPGAYRRAARAQLGVAA